MGSIREVKQPSLVDVRLHRYIQSFTMAGSLAIRTRPDHKSVTAALSPAGADGRDAEVKSGRNSPAVGTAVNRKVEPDMVTPPQIAPSLLLQRSDASRSSVGSIKSVSSTGSSIKIDSGFDSPIPSPLSLYNSTPTSPEENDSTPVHNKGTPSKSPRRPEVPRTDDDAQQSSGSPAAAVGKRRKSSAKSGSTPTSLGRASRLSVSLEPPAMERQRSSSAPGIVPQIKLGSSSDNPICLRDDDDHPPSSFGSLTSKDVNDAKISARKGRAASTALGGLATKQRSRTSSAAGRVEGSVTNIAGDLDVNTMPENTSDEIMDWEPTSAISLHTRLTDNSTVSKRNTKTRQPISPAGSSIAGVRALTKTYDTPKDSPAQIGSSRSGAIETSRSTGASLLVQRREVKGSAERAELVTRMKSSSKENGPSDTPEDDSGSGFDTESEPSYLTDNDLFATAITEPRDFDDGGAEFDQSSELSDPEFESNTSSELSDPGDTDGEPPYPDFRKFSGKAYNEKDIKSKLAKLIKKQNPALKPKNEKGDIYIYSAPACPGYFKVGLTYGSIPDRIDQQKTCNLGELLRVKDRNQGQIRYARLVDNLIKLELHNVRRKFPCNKCKNPNKRDGGPTVHCEWYEIDPECLLRVVEKWRSWITMPKNNPYDSNGNLTPRWVWKLKKHDENKKGMDLNSILQPFTGWEDLIYRKDWFVDWCWDLHTQRKEFSRVMMNSFLFLLISFTWLFFVYSLGLQPGSSFFVLLATLVVYMASGR